MGGPAAETGGQWGPGCRETLGDEGAGREMSAERSVKSLSKVSLGGWYWSRNLKDMVRPMWPLGDELSGRGNRLLDAPEE